MEATINCTYTWPMTSREESLAALLATHSVFYRPRKPFVLSSGKTSPFYFDCRRTTMLPEAMPLIGRLVFERIRGAVDAVGGLTMGADPIACAVGEPRRAYHGETKFPFILQNVHRYFMYAAVVFLFILWWDVILAARFQTPDGVRFGIGGGTLAILASTGLLTLYTLGCHSLRHLVGGKLDCFSCVVAGGPRHKTWSVVSVLNGRHMMWAALSLGAVCFADLYVRLCSMGVIRDWVFFPFDMFTNAGPTGL